MVYIYSLFFLIFFLYLYSYCRIFRQAIIFAVLMTAALGKEGLRRFKLGILPKKHAITNMNAPVMKPPTESAGLFSHRKRLPFQEPNLKVPSL